MALPYQSPGLVLARDLPNDPALVRALQRDLRALGYLRAGIDGAFGSGTEQAVRGLRYDLLKNQGASRGGDGPAPVAIVGFNVGEGGRPLVTTVNGTLDQNLALCIARLLEDERVVKLPSATDPAAENARALERIAGAQSTMAPTPFIAAIVMQESNGQHYRVPSAGDEDNFVVVGLDRGNRDAPEQITSRGYGIGQYTLFHHPPRPEEVAEVIEDPVRNIQQAYRELRGKFDGFVAGPQDRADDREAEHAGVPLRLCQYPSTDARYLQDCRACAANARKMGITQGSPFYAGASSGYQPDQYYPSADYSNVPDRADFPCDWPYAIRRYNGSGNDSYHYQTRVLLHLVAGY